ncbi:MAG: universal stress protein [Georgenia sp.]
MTAGQVPTGSVVVGIDGSPVADVAFDWAVEEAHRRGTGLHVLYAFAWLSQAKPWAFEPPTEAIEAGERLLHAAAERARAARPGLPVTEQLVVLDPASALVEASARAVVVVLGARGLRAVAGLVGSVSQKVAAHAFSPVVVVHGPPPVPGGPVVVGMDPVDSSPEAVRYAFEEAARRQTSVIAVQGVQEEPLLQLWEDRSVQERLDDAFAEAGKQNRAELAHWEEHFPGVPVEFRLVRMHPADALVQAAADAALVVVGSRGHSGLRNLVLGSVSGAVLRGAPVVAVVRVGQRSAEAAR